MKKIIHDVTFVFVCTAFLDEGPGRGHAESCQEPEG
jgi:hypothetical protein